MPASIILQLVYPLAKGIGARWVWSRGRRYRVYMKLDPVKVTWIIAQKETGALNSEIARGMGVSERRVQSLWSATKGEIGFISSSTSTISRQDTLEILFVQYLILDVAEGTSRVRFGCSGVLVLLSLLVLLPRFVLWDYLTQQDGYRTSDIEDQVYIVRKGHVSLYRLLLDSEFFLNHFNLSLKTGRVWVDFQQSSITLVYLWL
jgi:hypothetical protein